MTLYLFISHVSKELVSTISKNVLTSIIMMEAVKVFKMLDIISIHTQLTAKEDFITVIHMHHSKCLSIRYILDDSTFFSILHC